MEPVTPTTKLIVRSKRPEIAAGVNSPYILMQFAGGPGGPYSFGPALWNDQGSDSEYDVSIYRALSLPDNYYIVGDYAQNNYSSPTGYVPIVTAMNDDPNEQQGHVVAWAMLNAAGG